MSLSIDRADRNYVLLTGGTGLLGQFLIRQLLDAGQRVAVVVRPGKKLTARQRVENILQRLESETGTALPRPVVLTGDVCDEALGLDQESLDWVERHCSRVIHSAAVLTFFGAARDQDPWRTNLGGTRNVLQLCREMDIDELHYLSTAYVCGVRDERVMEEDLDCQQEFRNDYERCKFEAEQLVNSAEYISSRTIYRPAVIVGDSETGYTATYHGLFLYLRLMATLVPQQAKNADGVIETPLRLPMNGDEPRNLVPVDWVAEVVVHLFLTPEAHGRTYHLTPDHYSTARQVIEYGCEYYGSQGVEFLGPDAPRTADGEFAAKIFENVATYQDYETSDPEFDKSNVRQFAGHLPCPPVDRSMVRKFIEFGTSDRWGKRREKPPEVACCLTEFTTEMADASAEVLKNLTPEFPIGLDFRGAGGGQWHVMQHACGRVQVMQGLPADDCPVIVADTADLLAGNKTPDWREFFGSAVVGIDKDLIAARQNGSAVQA